MVQEFSTTTKFSEKEDRTKTFRKVTDTTSDQKEYIKDTFPGSSFSDSKDLEDLLRMTMPRSEIVFRLRRRCIDIAECPFHYLGPCSPEMFVGRAKEINDILLGAQNGYAVAGGRRIGKTSLLLKIQSEIKKGNYSCKKYVNIRFAPS